MDPFKRDRTMPTHGPTFERARNTTDLGALGDPERWGGHSVVQLIVPPVTTAQIQATGEQCIRVQTRDLIARDWDWICSWEFNFTGVFGSLVNPVAGLRFTWGAGQNSQSGIIQLGVNSAGGAGAFAGWLADFDGAGFIKSAVAQGPWPIPCASMAVVPILRVDAYPDLGPAAMRLTVDVAVAPRALTQ